LSSGKLTADKRHNYLIQVLVDTNWPRDALRHTQSSSCCAQSRMLRVIDRRRSSVDWWQHLATMDVPLQNCS